MQKKLMAYNLCRNMGYALSGLRDIIKNERAFQLELAVFIMLQSLLLFLEISFNCKVILSVSLFIPLVAEAANSAIERTVDLITIEYHGMAKRAKDAGSALVFLSIVLTVCIWGYTLYYFYYLS